MTMLSHPHEAARQGRRLVLDRGDRNALHGELLETVAAVRAMPGLIQRRCWSDARELRCRFQRAARLLDDLGWRADDPGCQFAITVDEFALRITLADIRQQALRRLVARADSFENAERNLLAVRTCDSLLAQLDRIGRAPAVSLRVRR